MVSKKELENFLQANTRRPALGALPDLLEVEIKGESPMERLESLVNQVGNPYYFRVGKTPVRLLYHNEEKTLQEKLKSYFLSLKSNDL